MLTWHLPACLPACLAPAWHLQMTIDILGVVVEVKPLGSVKRKTDQVELSRRDITLLDQRWAGGAGCLGGQGGLKGGLRSRPPALAATQPFSFPCSAR
jgi:hypothetical protein